MLVVEIALAWRFSIAFGRRSGACLVWRRFAASFSKLVADGIAFGGFIGIGQNGLPGLQRVQSRIKILKVFYTQKYPASLDIFVLCN